jgi:hypothetical protein
MVQLVSNHQIVCQVKFHRVIVSVNRSIRILQERSEEPFGTAISSILQIHPVILALDKLPDPRPYT